MAPPTTIPNLFMSDFGLNTDDIKYFHMDSHIQGRGPNRLKSLDIEGRWILSGKSIPFISAAFNHLERLNDAQVPIRGIDEEPINAIGMVGWTNSSVPAEEPPKEEKKVPKKFVLQPPVFVEDEVPPSPREVVPHRSAGYGPAHHKRKLSIPDRSRSVSPMPAETPGQTVYDKYAKYERHRKDSITRYGTKWGDAGYVSHSPSPTGDEPQNPPHRTQALSPRPASRTRQYDSEYNPEFLKKDSASTANELKVLTKNIKGDYVPYRTTGYGAYHVKRQYELSPRSMGSDYATSSGSEQSSPVPARRERSADEIVLSAYHASKTTDSRPRRDNWIRQQ
uniref:ZM domain-containing protein n=1 Tax=Caenorhabditis tropicalis TaxID=1561998 RepID=A0A1I7UQ45_9PELO